MSGIGHKKRKRAEGRQNGPKGQVGYVAVLTTRECRSHDGKIKRAYPTRRLARDQAERVRLKTGDRRLRAYSCPRCGQYHLGHFERSEQ